ncbi:MAG TPA: site-specific integrase [Blastocatellia bacterium]|nr:site-specific integrase [Blastocatellia bacterium]
MARESYQKGRIELRERRHGTVYVLRYRLRQGGVWVEKTEELKNRRGLPCRNDREARIAADKRMRVVNSLNNHSQHCTMAEFVNGLWQHHVRKVKPSTAYSYDCVMRRHVLPEFGDRALLEITPADVTRFFGGLNELSPTTRLTLYRLLKFLFTIAVEHDLIPTNPVRQKLHRPEARRAEKPALSAAEIRKVIAAAEAKYRPLFLCLAVTGMRIGEALALRWQDVDFARGRLTVKHTLWRRQLLEPKTEGSKRSLHLPGPLLEVLRAQYQSSRWNGPDDFVFAREDGAPLNVSTVRDGALRAALSRAGIPRGNYTHGFHLFRHSAATIVHALTRDLSLAQELLGHSQISTTADIYTHTRSAAEEATETLAREICGLTVAEGSTQVN